MSELTYFAIFEPAKAGGYGVYFPDFPGCVSYGETFEEAQKQAEDALGMHICGMMKDGEEIPVPSKEPKVDPETVSGYIIFPVSVSLDKVEVIYFD